MCLSIKSDLFYLKIAHALELISNILCDWSVMRTPNDLKKTFSNILQEKSLISNFIGLLYFKTFVLLNW